MPKLVYLGPDAALRTHFGVRVKGEPFEPEGGELDWVKANLPGHRIEAAEAASQDFAARTKPAPARKK